MEVKKTTKIDGKLKSLHFEGNALIDENGEIVELEKYLKAAYGDKYFDVSFTTKEEEILEIDAYIDFAEDEE